MEKDIVTAANENDIKARRPKKRMISRFQE
jgi:hypothetical protein